MLAARGLDILRASKVCVAHAVCQRSLLMLTGSPCCCAVFAQYDFSGEKYSNMYSSWFDKDTAWTDTFIGQAFRQTGDFATLGSRGRAEGIEKATTSSIMVSMVLHELDTAVNKVSQQSLSDNDGGYH